MRPLQCLLVTTPHRHGMQNFRFGTHHISVLAWENNNLFIRSECLESGMDDCVAHEQEDGLKDEQEDTQRKTAGKTADQEMRCW